jgi:hypothetical protein
VSVDQLLPDARELARRKGELPSKDHLMKAFRIGRPKANELHGRLLAEVAERRQLGRRVMRRIATRKATGRVLTPRPRTLPAAPVSPGVGPMIAQPTPVAATPAQPFRNPSGRVVTWPAVVVAIPAAVAIWAGWVAIGKLTGFGRVNLLPGFGRGWVVDTAITLPVGVEAYAAYAFYVALNPAAPARARRFAAWSAGLAVLLGMGGQTAFHLMSAAHMSAAPWQITTLVSCLPVGVFAVVAALVHLVRGGGPEREN